MSNRQPLQPRLECIIIVERLTPFATRLKQRLKPHTAAQSPGALSFRLVRLSGSTTTAIAQDSGCYMVTTAGKVVNLRGLCGGGSTGQTSTPQRAALPSRAGVFQVPIKRRDQGIPVLDVTFNGNQTFELLMDSGASVTVLPQRMAAALGVVPIGTATVTTASAKRVAQGVGRVRSISVGGATLNNALVLLAGPELEAGLLGQNFLKHYDVLIKQDVVEFHVR